MKKLFLSFLLSMGMIVSAYAQTNVPQGGTGITSVPDKYILMGSTTLRLQAVSTTTLAYLLNVAKSVGSQYAIQFASSTAGFFDSNPVFYFNPLNNYAVVPGIQPTPGSTFTVADEGSVSAIEVGIGGGLTLPHLLSGFLRTNGSGAVSAQTAIDLGTPDVTNTLPLSKGGTGVASYTVGSIPFADASSLTEDNANFFWDNSAKRLGIGDATPSYNLDVAGTASIGTDLHLPGYADGCLYVNTGLVISTTTCASGGSTPGGSANDVQLNDGAGGFAGSSALRYDSLIGLISIPGFTASDGLGNYANAGSIYDNGLGNIFLSLGGAGTVPAYLNLGTGGGLYFNDIFTDFNMSSMTASTTLTIPDESGTLALGTGIPGNCAIWSSTSTLTDTGSPCGSGGGTPGGSDTDVQFNDSGSFGGVADFIYDKTVKVLSLVGSTSDGSTFIQKWIDSSAATVASIASNGLATFTSLVVDSGAAGTSTIQIGSSGHPGCIKVRDASDGGFTYLYTEGGVMFVDTISCE